MTERYSFIKRNEFHLDCSALLLQTTIHIMQQWYEKSSNENGDILIYLEYLGWWKVEFTRLGYSYLWRNEIGILYL